ncbi:MAG TPA: hypothetical protein VN622_17380 [Clostridia bacterium]|nr:hypothetical protein [Clostridia bacterium]
MSFEKIRTFPMYACVYIPGFLSEAIVRTRAELRPQAVVVIEGTPPLKNPDTKKRRDTRSQVAVALCLRSHEQERAAHAALLDAAHAFSPRVEDTASDTVLLDLSGLERLFGMPQKIARELARRVTDVGLEANIAVAANPYTAMHAARGFAGITVLEPGTEAERLASLNIEHLFATPAFAATAPTGGPRKRRDTADAQKRAARILETLDRWGVRNFRALAALPAVSLSERLGAEGVRLQQLARGAVTRDLVLAEPQLAFEEALELDYPVELIEPLAFLLGRMLEQLCARMNGRALATNELRLRMQLEHRVADESIATQNELDDAMPTIERRLTLPVPMNDARLFLKLLHLELNSNPPGAPVIKLCLVAEPARPRVTQSGLFMPLAPEPEKLELTLARIDRVLRGTRECGDHPSAHPKHTRELRAGSVETIDTNQPDAFRMTRFTPKSPEQFANTSAPEPSTRTVVALRRFRPPLGADVALREGRPIALSCESLGASEKRSAKENVVWAAGPWRINGNWWMAGEEGSESRETKQNEHTQPSDLKHRDLDGACTWQRDQWDIAVAITTTALDKRSPETQHSMEETQRQTNIALYRIFCDATTREWFVDGCYD